MSDVDKHIVKEKDGWWFWDEIGLHIIWSIPQQERSTAYVTSLL